MRVLVFHGYLLRGTGSNVYNANLAAALARLGHEVHLLCQERDPPPLPGVHVHRPDIGEVLPVYVADSYEGFRAKPFAELTDAELAHYLDANVAAVREVAARARPQVALANHLVMGPVVLARALGGEVPYAVKVHGSALEYTVKPHPERFLPFAREGLARAGGVLVGSRHTAESLWATIGDPGLPARTRLGPPGVDVAAFAPRPPAEGAAGLSRLEAGLRARGGREGAGSAFSRDDARAADALARLDPGRDRLVAFVGKLIVSKGIDLLLAAWPLVLARAPDARLVVVGFGAFQEAAERLARDLAAGDLGAVRDLAMRGRAAEGGPPGRLSMLEAFLDGLERDPAARRRYLAAASATDQRVVFTGRLEHPELAELLPACEALTMPSTFPEAFGMVAAEAAASGVFPVSAAHSGLAEVSEALAAALPQPARPWLSFPLGPSAVEELGARLAGWLAAPAPLRDQVRGALVSAARERYSWEGVARGVIAAAQGRLDELAFPADRMPPP
jgi:glycosyltransferase involved in cell wall biosynthesis